MTLSISTFEGNYSQLNQRVLQRFLIIHLSTDASPLRQWLWLQQQHIHNVCFARFAVTRSCVPLLEIVFLATVFNYDSKIFQSSSICQTPSSSNPQWQPQFFARPPSWSSPSIPWSHGPYFLQLLIQHLNKIATKFLVLLVRCQMGGAKSDHEEHLLSWLPTTANWWGNKHSEQCSKVKNMQIHVS